MQQMTISDYMAKKTVCSGCIFLKEGVCSHISGSDFGCEKGSFKIRQSKAKCPECGNKVEIRQTKLGGDYAICRKCHKQITFNNKGNRKTAFEMWKSHGGLKGVKNGFND